MLWLFLTFVQALQRTMNTLRAIQRLAPAFTLANSAFRPLPASINPALAIGIRGYATRHRQAEGKQILVRDYGVIGTVHSL